MTESCRECGRELTRDETALYRRMVNRAAASFMCLSCLAAYFRCDESLLRCKIEQFRAAGCTLFRSREEGALPAEKQ